MQVRVITLRYNEGQQGFAEDALRKATFGREVLSVESHFFTHGNVPHVALVLTLGDGVPEGAFRPRDPNALDPGDQLPDERKVNDLIAKIVRHPLPGARPGFGLPVGNLTSQWFANSYLDELNHRIVEGWGQGAAYVRYMDDMCLFADDKSTAWGLHDRIRAWLEAERGLSLKNEATIVAPTDEGMPFLGLRIFPGCWRLKRTRFQRTRHVFAVRMRAFEEGRLDERGYAQTVASLDGALRWYGFKNILTDLATGEGAVSGSNRVNRGGSYNNNANNCRSAYRNNNPSNNNNLGFRLVSIMLANRQAGSHPVPPGLREAETNMRGYRSASSFGHRRAESLPFQLMR